VWDQVLGPEYEFSRPRRGYEVQETAGANTSSKFTEEMALPNAFSANFLPERRHPDRRYDELVQAAPDVSRADQAEEAAGHLRTRIVGLERQLEQQRSHLTECID
jgi:hypothetical protein